MVLYGTFSIMNIFNFYNIVYKYMSTFNLINKCAPSRKFNSNTDCFTLEELHEFIKTYSNIPVSEHISDNKLYDIALHISKKMNNCDDLNCIISEKERYIPEYPYNNNKEWLSNIDIDNILYQYEDQLTYFKYILINIC